MVASRPFLALHTTDHWLRCGHEGTVLDPKAGIRLLWKADQSSPSQGSSDAAAAVGGLAFDPWCRLYVSLPNKGQVQRISVVGSDPAQGKRSEPPAPVDLFARPPMLAGNFQPLSAPAPLRQPQGIAIDADGRLFVAEAGACRILIYDLWDDRLLRLVKLPRLSARCARPIDVAWDGECIWAALDGPPGLVVLDARQTPRPALPTGRMTAVSRIAAAANSDPVLLVGAGTPGAQVIPLRRPEEAFSVPFATDLEFELPRKGDIRLFDRTASGEAGTSILVVARQPGEDFLRFAIAPGQRLEMPHLKGRGYTGGGLVQAPDGRIGFWTARGFRTAMAATPRSVRRGRLSCFCLDAKEHRNVWGRIFVDACLPAGTDLRVHVATSDEPPEEANDESPEDANNQPPEDTSKKSPEKKTTVERKRPENARHMKVHRCDLSPPMLPLSLAPPPDAPGQRLFRRRSGRELPWLPPTAAFITYEAPVAALPGRYLWITIDFIGDGRASPHLYGIRIERNSHDLLRRLPALYSRDALAADFLRRMLAGMEGMLSELDARADQRRTLLDPASTPQELLPWLAGFMGLVLDRRWPESTQRRLIGEAAWLFRFRGTLPGLVRFLHMVTGKTVVILEHFRTRGLGGAYVGDADAFTSRAILGAGFRVGGRAGGPGDGAVLGAEPSPDADALHAHRFTVVIAAALSEEERAVIEHVLALHRPAHTVYELCTVDSGMRMGVGLYVGLTTTVGRSGGFTSMQVGSSHLGDGAVVGRPTAGTRLGGSRVGLDSRVG